MNKAQMKKNCCIKHKAEKQKQVQKLSSVLYCLKLKTKYFSVIATGFEPITT